MVYLPLLKFYESQLGWLFPIYGKIKAMFQTTNQINYVFLPLRGSPQGYLEYLASSRCFVFLTAGDIPTIQLGDNEETKIRILTKTYCNIFTGWWFQPLWNIWVRQLGWLSHILWNHKKFFQTTNQFNMLYLCSFMLSLCRVNHNCLVVDLPLSKIWVRQLGWFFPNIWEIWENNPAMFQTTNQYIDLLSPY